MRQIHGAVQKMDILVMERRLQRLRHLDWRNGEDHLRTILHCLINRLSYFLIAVCIEIRLSNQSSLQGIRHIESSDLMIID